MQPEPASDSGVLRDDGGRFAEGTERPPGSGRPKGGLNKATKAIKEALLQSFENQGGAAFFDHLAAEHPQAYAQLLAKLIPAELRAELEHSQDRSGDEMVAALHRGRERARRSRERAQRERPVAPEVCDGKQP